MKRKSKTNEQYINQKTAIERYGVTKKIIDQYFPKPLVKYYGRYRYTRLWRERDVVEAISQPEVQELLAEIATSRRRERDLAEARSLLLSYTPDSLIEKAKQLKRVFVLHVGPTNSGKTPELISVLFGFLLSKCSTESMQTVSPAAC